MRFKKIIINGISLCLIIFLSMYIISCAQKTVYEPAGFDELLKKIKEQDDNIHDGEIFNYTPSDMYFYIYFKKDNREENRVSAVRDAIFKYIQSNEFQKFLKNSNNIYYDNSFFIVIYLKMPKDTFIYSVYKESHFKEIVSDLSNPAFD